MPSASSIRHRVPSVRSAGLGPKRPPGIPGFTLVELLVVISIIAILIGILIPALTSSREVTRGALCMSNLKQVGMVMDAYASEYKQQYVRAAADINTTNLQRWHGTRLATPPFSPPYPQPVSQFAFDPTQGPLSSYFGDSGQVKRCPSFDQYVKTNDPSLNEFEAGCGGYGMNQMFVGSRCWDVGQYDNPVSYSGDGGNALCSKSDEFKKPFETVSFMDNAIAQKSGSLDYVTEYSFIQMNLNMDSSPPYGPVDSSNPAYYAPTPTEHFRHLGNASVLWLDGHVVPQAMAYTSTTNAYGGNNQLFNIGFFGPDDFSLFDTN